MNFFEKLSLQMVAVGTAMLWILPYLIGGSGAPDWLISRWPILVGASAILFGSFALSRHGGFAKSAPVLTYSFLVAAGCAWTPESEMGRGLLIAAAFLMVLPITALALKHEYLERFLTQFSLTGAASMAYALLSTGSLTLRDSMGSNTTNTNGVGIQASFSALILIMYLRERRGLGRAIYLICILFLVVCSTSTASRTAFLALLGAILLSILLRSRRSALQILSTAIVGTALAIGISDALETENPFYRGIVGRLFLDEEGTRGSLGDRTQIWTIALSAAVEDSTWLYGTGTGGVDAALGGLYESNGRSKGRDGIWRLSPHNTVVWGLLAHGIPGLIAMVWLWVRIARDAVRMDLQLRSWEHTTFIGFLTFSSFGGVITQDGCWAVMGVAMLAGLSQPGPAIERTPVVQGQNLEAAWT